LREKLSDIKKERSLRGIAGDISTVGRIQIPSRLQQKSIILIEEAGKLII